MHTTTTIPPGQLGSKRPSWALRHPFWAAFLGGLAAVTVLVGAFAAWQHYEQPWQATARPAATAAAPAHKAHHHHPRPAKTVYVTPPAPQAVPAAPQAPTGLHEVAGSGGIYASSQTSDAFAENVVRAWNGQDGVQDVYSPVTGQTYAMTYQIQPDGSIVATGGNGAYVQF